MNAERRDRQVRRLVRHAYERVPYYRRLFDLHGVRADRIRGVADLTHIPTTTRADLAALPEEEIVAVGFDPERLIAVPTGGASGLPFTPRRTWLEQQRLELVRARALLRVGVHLGDRLARVCPLDAPAPRFLGSVLPAAGVVRDHAIDALLPPSEIAGRLAALKPDVVAGTPDTLALVADAFPAGRSPRLVLCGSDTLTGDLRVRIERGFGAPVRDLYSSAEFTLIAAECGTGGAMHVCRDGVVHEVVRNDDRAVAAGAVGELVGTSLHAFAMPLIRYRQGDLVMQGDDRCECGHAGPTVRAVVGRKVDLFPLPGGRLLHPHELVACFREDLGSWVAQYQLVQQAVDHVVLRIVPRGDTPAGRVAAIEAGGRALLGPRVQFDVAVAAALPLDASGAVRTCQSHVRPTYDRVA